MRECGNTTLVQLLRCKDSRLWGTVSIRWGVYYDTIGKGSGKAGIRGIHIQYIMSKNGLYGVHEELYVYIAVFVPWMTPLWSSNSLALSSNLMFILFFFKHFVLYCTCNMTYVCRYYVQRYIHTSTCYRQINTDYLQYILFFFCFFFLLFSSSPFHSSRLGDIYPRRQACSNPPGSPSTFPSQNPRELDQSLLVLGGIINLRSGFDVRCNLHGTSESFGHFLVYLWTIACRPEYAHGQNNNMHNQYRIL